MDGCTSGEEGLVDRGFPFWELCCVVHVLYYYSCSVSLDGRWEESEDIGKRAGTPQATEVNGSQLEAEGAWFQELVWWWIDRNRGKDGLEVLYR